MVWYHRLGGTMKLSRQGIEQIIAEYREAVGQTKLKETDIEEFIESISGTLFDYCEEFPEGTEFEYVIRKRFRRMELIISIPGEKKNIYECGMQSEERKMARQIHAMKLASSLDMQYVYLRGCNTLIFLSPPVRNHSVLLNPMIMASLIGLVLGLLCSLLPSNFSGFLVNDLASPVLSVAIKLITGVMGPIIFLSLITAISTMDSINEFNRLGTWLFKRFLVIAVMISAVALAVALLSFSFSRGHSDITFSSRIVIDMLISVIPTNLVMPFVENNFPQLLVLGLVMGIALLLLNRRESILSNAITDLHDWINELLRIILKLTPIIPCLTLFKIFAQRDFSSFIQGWKYIASVYVCMALVLIAKLIRTKVHCRKLDFSLLMRRMLPVIQTAFYSGSEIVALKKFTETVEGPIAISKNYSSLWTPLNQSMLAPIGSISFVLAPFFVAEITGTPISVNFIFVLLILSVQLSLAYPGIVAGNTIIFSAVGLSTDYVGMFSAYNVFIKNASAAFGITFRLLEITETAYDTDNIDIEKFSRD